MYASCVDLYVVKGNSEKKDYNQKLTSSSMVLVDGSVNVMDDVAYSSS